MADQGKKVLMILPDGSEAYFPEANVKAAQDLGAKLSSTTPPPTKGVTELATAASQQARGAAETSGSAARAVAGVLGDFTAGIGTSLTAIPGQVMRLAGGDPSKVELPFPQITPTGERIPATLESIGKPPETMAGKTGEVVGEAMQLATGGAAVKGAAKYGAKALTKAPQVVNLAAKAAPRTAKMAKIIEDAAASSPKIAAAVEWAAKTGTQAAQDIVTSAAMEYSKTGNAEEALANAEKGAGIVAGLSTLGKAVAPTGKWLVGKAMTRITDFPDYHMSLIDRLYETGSKFTKAGKQAIEARAKGVVKAMKDASDKADYWLRQANAQIASGTVQDPSGIIPKDGRMVPFAQILNKEIGDLLTKAGGSTTKVGSKIAEALNDIKKQLPQDQNGNFINLTFKEAEEKKETLQAALTEFYHTLDKNTIDDQTLLRVRKAVADSIREGQRAGFDILKSAMDKVKLPNIKDMKPYQIWLPGAKRPVDYKEAGRTAMKDYDLLELARMYELENLPQRKGSAGTYATASISASQLANQSYLTPSQMSWIARKVFSPATLTTMPEVMARAQRAGRAIGPTVGTQITTRAVGERTAKPPSMTEWIQQQAAPASQNSSINYDSPLNQ
jgi:hypothetical protein